MDRRHFLFTSSGAAAGSLLAPGLTEAADAAPAPYAGSGLVTGAPKPLRHTAVPVS